MQYYILVWGFRYTLKRIFTRQVVPLPTHVSRGSNVVSGSLPPHQPTLPHWLWHYQEACQLLLVQSARIPPPLWMKFFAYWVMRCAYLNKQREDIAHLSPWCARGDRPALFVYRKQNSSNQILDGWIGWKSSLRVKIRIKFCSLGYWTCIWRCELKAKAKV